MLLDNLPDLPLVDYSADEPPPPHPPLLPPRSPPPQPSPSSPSSNAAVDVATKATSAIGEIFSFVLGFNCLNPNILVSSGVCAVWCSERPYLLYITCYNPECSNTRTYVRAIEFVYFPILYFIKCTNNN